MSSGKRSLRYASEADMPPSMRLLLNKPIEEARNKLLASMVETIANTPKPSVLVHKTTAIGPTTFKPLAKNKYGAVATTVDGIRFDSKREARYYEQLKLRQAAGEIRYWLRQAPIHLPGGTRLVIDFLEFHADGSVHYVDVKGRETPAFKIKRREIQAIYPIRIELA